MNKRILSLFFAVLLLVTLALPMSALANTASMYVISSNGKGVHLREKPQANADNVVITVPYGAEVDILSTVQSGQWAHITWTDDPNNKTYEGYMMTRYLTTEIPPAYKAPQPAQTQPEQAEPKMPNFANFKLVTPYNVIVRPSKPSGFVNFRWAPSTDCKVIMRCYANYPLQVIAQDGTWAQLRDPATGYVGFMLRSFLTEIVAEDGAPFGSGVLVY